jgi:hypothetical protein
VTVKRSAPETKHGVYGCSNNHMLIAHRLQRQPPPVLISDTDGEQLQELSQPFEVTGLITMVRLMLARLRSYLHCFYT